jgi:hypothetical protein
MKQFYSCIDARLPAPQPEQHEASKIKAMREGGLIVFYGAEEYRVAHYQPFILNKLQKTPSIDGVVFFTIDQFCYGQIFNLKLLCNILKSNFNVHFAREDISFNSIEEVMDQFICLSAYFHAFKRNRDMVPEQILSILL